MEYELLFALEKKVNSLLHSRGINPRLFCCTKGGR